MSRSRAVFLSALAFALAAPARAVPTTITYAGYLTNGGAPVDGPVDIVVELYDDRTGGAALFTETFASTVVPDGDLVLELGTLTPLDTALLDTAELWLEVSVDGTTLAPRARLSSVPYALLAGEAATLEGLTAADIQGQIDALAAQIASAQTQLTSLQASLNALASAGGPPVAFANVTGLSFQAPLSFSAGNLTVGTDALTASHIANNAVTTAEIAADTVAAADIASGAVGTAEIADGAITRADVGTNSQRVVYRHPTACSLADALFFNDPGNCNTVSCTGGLCASPPCYRDCNNLCVDAAAAISCPAAVAGYLLRD